MSQRYGNYVTPAKESSFEKRNRQTRNGEVPARNSKYDTLPAAQLKALCDKVGMTDQEKRNAAVSNADAHSWLATNPQYIFNKANNKIIDHLLSTYGVLATATYADYQRAYDAANASGLLLLDAAELARDEPREFKGPITGRTFDTFDALISAERAASIQKMLTASDDELEMDDVPNEQLLPMLKQLAYNEEHAGDAAEVKLNADAWISLRPTYRDSTRNANLLMLQIKTNGGTGTIEDFEIANRDLMASDLLTQNPKAVAEQRQAEVTQRAADAVAEPGSIFRSHPIEDAENMDLDQLKAICNGQLKR
jgi:hypothetical protein